MRIRWLAPALLAVTPLMPLAVIACGGDAPPPPVTVASPVPPPPPTDPSPPPAPATAATPAADSAPSAPAAAAAPPDRSSKLATAKHDPAWSACHSSFKSKAAPEAAVAAMARGCAAATKMKLLGKPESATLDSQGQPRSYPLHARAGKCYRVFGFADPGVTDLDIVLLDSTGATAGEDETTDPSPVIAEDGAVCFQAEDYATVVARVESGKGKVAIQVWSDE